jgi:hypothetical protein
LESIERAIRNAFAKADAHNPATRQRIYEAAWGAHERALTTNTALRKSKTRFPILKLSSKQGRPRLGRNLVWMPHLRLIRFWAMMSIKLGLRSIPLISEPLPGRASGLRLISAMKQVFRARIARRRSVRRL